MDCICFRQFPFSPQQTLTIEADPLRRTAAIIAGSVFLLRALHVMNIGKYTGRNVQLEEKAKGKKYYDVCSCWNFVFRIGDLFL